MIIKLTTICDTYQYINTDYIVSMARRKNEHREWMKQAEYTEIKALNKWVYEVKETPEEIMNMIKNLK